MSGSVKYRGLFYASVAVALAATVLSWLWLPSGRIPSHFTADGTVDGWGTRNELLGYLAPVTVGLALLMGWLSARIPTMSWVYLNVPHKEYWSSPENEARARARLQEDGYLIGSATMWLMTVVVIAVAASARRAVETGSAGWLGLAAVLVATVGLLVGALVRQRWYRKNRDA